MTMNREARLGSEQQLRRWATQVFIVAFLLLWLVGMVLGLSWWRAGLLAGFGVGVNGLLLLGGPPPDPREPDEEGVAIES